MESLNVLRSEHSSVLGQLYELDQQLGRLESSGPHLARKILFQLLARGEKLASDLAFHFQREEKSLYAALEDRMGEKSGPVATMKREHTSLEISINRFTSEVGRMLNDHDAVKTWELTSCLQDLRSGLSDHVSREEKVLFWLAELHLSRTDRNRISAELAQVRGEKSYNDSS